VTTTGDLRDTARDLLKQLARRVDPIDLLSGIDPPDAAATNGDLDNAQ
jgi:hypothetical protein